MRSSLEHPESCCSRNVMGSGIDGNCSTNQIRHIIRKAIRRHVTTSTDAVRPVSCHATAKCTSLHSELGTHERNRHSQQSVRIWLLGFSSALTFANWGLAFHPLAISTLTPVFKAYAVTKVWRLHEWRIAMKGALEEQGKARPNEDMVQAIPCCSDVASKVQPSTS